MTASADRPPFDDEDASRAAAYLALSGRTSFDPLAPENANGDLIMTTSIADARLMMAESFATRNAAWQPFRVFPLFVERSSLDAFAKDLGGLQVCGVNIGLVSAVYELSLFVFSQARMFPDIGNAAGERSPALPVDAALAFWISDRVRAGEGADGRPVGAELVPQDQDRQMAALFLTLLMLRFVWLHELFHCLNGHAGYLASQSREITLHEVTDGAELSLVELDEGKTTPGAVGEGHCMEFDADRSAYWVMMKRQLIGEEPIELLLARPLLVRLQLANFAAVLMTFLFDQAAKRQRSEGATHPVAYDRLHNLVRTMASNLAEPDGQMRQVFAHTLVEMDRLHGCVPQAAAGSPLVEDLRDGEMQGAFDRVEVALAEVRSRLATWQFGGGSIVLP